MRRFPRRAVVVAVASSALAAASYALAAGREDAKERPSGGLTLEASSTSVAAGQKIVLRGRTTLPGEPVLIRSAPAGGAWRDAAVVTPHPDGSYAVAVTPHGATRYRAVAADGQLRSAEVHVAPAAPARPVATTHVLQLLAPVGGKPHLAPRVVTARPGRVTIVLDNLDLEPHNIALRGGGVHVEGRVVGVGGTSRVTADLSAGKYTLYSSVDGQKAGPVGVLVVQ